MLKTIVLSSALMLAVSPAFAAASLTGCANAQTRSSTDTDTSTGTFHGYSSNPAPAGAPGTSEVVTIITTTSTGAVAAGCQQVTSIETSTEVTSGPGQSL